MTSEVSQSYPFPGFPELRANVTFVPLQFFTVVLPHRRTGCVRIVGFLLRKLLGWVDSDGNPTREQVELTYRELVEGAGVPRISIGESIREAIESRLIECIREPRPDERGKRSQSGIYRLRWSDGYTNDPDEFDGFCRQEAVAVEDSGVQGRQLSAKVARKNIPNAFFDYVLPRERLSVIRAVGVMLFRSIQWTSAGERKVDVSISVSELSRLTHMARRHVHQAVQSAMRSGYINIVAIGCFDPEAGVKSEAATYRIRWTEQTPVPVLEPHPTPHETPPVRKGIRERYEKGYEGPVQNGIRDRYKKVHGDRYEKGYDISVKTSINTQTTTARENRAGVAAGREVTLLVEAGFDPGTAELLAATVPSEVIQNQVEWLQLRKPARNRLGMLRRAILENWKPPESPPSNSATSLGQIFTQHYELALQGHHVGACSEKEIGVAEKLLNLVCPMPSTELAVEWGKRFGEYVRAKSPTKPWLAWTAKLYGSEFLSQVTRKAARKGRVLKAEGRTVHEDTYREAYEGYLEEVLAEVRRGNPELWQTFRKHQAEITQRLNLCAESRALLETRGAQASAFADFLRSKGHKIPGFWDWDVRQNPERFQAAVELATSADP